VTKAELAELREIAACSTPESRPRSRPRWLAFLFPLRYVSKD
jgi:hypothetical protein